MRRLSQYLQGGLVIEKPELLIIIDLMRIKLVHIPKNAGNAVLETYSEQGVTVWGHNVRDVDYKKFPEDLKWKLVRKFPIVFAKYYNSFAIIRNPWDRVYSAYNYLSKGGNCDEDYQDYERYVKPFNDFNHFVKAGLKTASEKQLHFLPQLSWITDRRGKIVVDHVLMYEKLEIELSEYIKSRGLNPKKLKVVNKKNFKDYKHFYSNESTSIVRNIYAETIERFNYDFN